MLFATVFQRLYGLSTVVLRPTLVFGAGQPQDKLIPYIISSLRRGAEPILANPNRICDLLYVRDLVHALCLAAVKPGIEGSTIDVGSGHRMSVAHIALRIARLLDRSISLEIEPARAVCESDLVVDTEPAARLLAWRADWEFDIAMRATIDSYAPIIERRNVA
jgi:nucleoside-diphosphate-sugar epimerase